MICCCKIVREKTPSPTAERPLKGSFMSEETVELEDVSVEAETDLALLCNIDDKKHWIPKSVVHEDSEVSSEGDTGTIVLQRWFAEKEGLV